MGNAPRTDPNTKSSGARPGGAGKNTKLSPSVVGKRLQEGLKQVPWALERMQSIPCAEGSGAQ